MARAAHVCGCYKKRAGSMKGARCPAHQPALRTLTVLARTVMPCHAVLPRTQQVPFMPLEVHTRFRYLLSCDGNTASARLGKLMLTDSVVLKQVSI